MSRSEPSNDGEVLCILQPRFNISDFRFVQETKQPLAQLRVDLAHNPMSASEYPRTRQITVQLDQGALLQLDGQIDGEAVYFGGWIKDPLMFFTALAHARLLTLGTQEMGFVLHDLRGSARAVEQFSSCTSDRVASQPTGTLPYGTRVGMDVTIMNSAGIDSNLAEIRIEHSMENAKAFCREYVGDDSQACVETTMVDVEIEDRVVASCSSGEFTTPTGGRFKFEGRNAAAERMEGGEFKIRDTRSGELLSFNSASGYEVALAAFSALCPSRVR